MKNWKRSVQPERQILLASSHRTDLFRAICARGINSKNCPDTKLQRVLHVSCTLLYNGILRFPQTSFGIISYRNATRKNNPTDCAIPNRHAPNACFFLTTETIYIAATQAHSLRLSYTRARCRAVHIVKTCMHEKLETSCST